MRCLILTVAIIALLLILLALAVSQADCTPEPKLPPHGRWIVENRGVKYWMYWCPDHGTLLIDGTIIAESRKDKLMAKQRTTDRLEQKRKLDSGDTVTLRSRNVDGSWWRRGYHYLKIGKARGARLTRSDLRDLDMMISNALGVDRTL